MVKSLNGVLRILLLSSLFLAAMASSAQVPENLYNDLHWRSIGPLARGRTRAAAGVPSQPNVFYMGQVNGGVWKSNDYGRTWNPIFDQQPTQSIGAIAVAPSDPNIIYVASGEGLHRPDLSVGDGIYKSTDAGKTWTHLGLRDGQQIPALAVDPRDPNRYLPLCSGIHMVRARSAESIARRMAGRTGRRSFTKDENTGGIGCGNRSVESRRRLRLAVGSARGAVGRRQRVQRHRRRAVQVDRRRQHVAAVDERTARAICRRSSRDCAQRSEAALRDVGHCGRRLRSTRAGLYRSDDAGETLGADHRRSASGDDDRRRRSCRFRESIRKIPTSSTAPAS